MDIKCAIYARYSSENQREASIEDQIRKCRDFAAQKGWIVLEEHIYFDKAQTGFSTENREAFSKLYSLITSGKAPFQYLLIDETSRLSRNINQALNIHSIFRFHNVQVFCVSQGIDSSQEFSEEMIAFHAIKDHMFIKETGKRTHRGLEGQFLKGFSTGGKHYGYKSKPVYSDRKDIYGNPIAEGYVLEVNQEESRVIREIFTLFGEKGWSAKRIVNFLNKRLLETGAPKPPKGKFWTVSTIIGSKNRNRGILNNELYIGKIVWNKTTNKKNPITGKKKIISNSPENWKILIKEEYRIVPDELWVKVKSRQNELEKKHKGRYTEAKKLYSKNLLTPYAKCGHCGGTFGIVSGGTYAKYGCTNNWNKGNSVCQNTPKIEKSLFEESIINTLAGQISDKKSIEKILEELYINFETYFEDSFLESNLTELKREIDQISVEINNLINAIKMGITSESVKKALIESENKKRELENKVSLNSLNSKPNVRDLIQKDDLKLYFDEIAEKLINPETTFNTFSDFVEKIVVLNFNSYAEVEIIEKTDNTMQFLLELIAKRDCRIRLQTGTHLQPYTSRIFKLSIPLSNSLKSICDDHKEKILIL
ncbi:MULTISPECIES: recombinase family protein [Thermodesulfovibrio]|jgi:DNA invertase Pin-like site-specific DNA recombinase|uniref:recombinase family protein n=1 Tax=Thermodesulfovibrio TaxID=28261 RepID=UPI002620A2AD|nr:recombinase family protein [Thermodesulfovibrio sp.]